jgi:hypothetical protein
VYARGGRMRRTMGAMHTDTRVRVTTGGAGRAEILRLAAAAGVDPRTAARALRDGVDAVRGPHRVREALRAAMTDLGRDAGAQ